MQDDFKRLHWKRQKEKKKSNLKKKQAQPLPEEKQHHKTLLPLGHQQQTITKAKSLQKPPKSRVGWM